MFLRMFILFGLVLASCGPTHAPILEPTPESHYQSVASLDNTHHFAVNFHINSDCVHTGQPLHMVVDITHTGPTTYSASLDEPIFDIVLDAYSFRKQWRWSETLPPEDVPFNLTLAPSATYTIEWTWIADPFFAAQQHPKSFRIYLTYREYDSLPDEIMKTDFAITLVYIDAYDYGTVCPL